jgi:hypothetical protein
MAYRRWNETTANDTHVDAATAAKATPRRWLGNRSWNELVAAWRSSDRQLVTAAEPERKLDLVILRAGLLDLMEQHNPRDFGAWLAEQSPRS